MSVDPGVLAMVPNHLMLPCERTDAVMSVPLVVDGDTTRMLAPSGITTVTVSVTTAMVVGAGSMGALSLATLRRAGASPLYVTNRDAARAQRLADLHGATPVPFGSLADTMARVDLVISATAATVNPIFMAVPPPERISIVPVP